jgi:hypothetical protein
MQPQRRNGMVRRSFGFAVKGRWRKYPAKGNWCANWSLAWAPGLCYRREFPKLRALALLDPLLPLLPLPLLLLLPLLLVMLVLLLVLLALLVLLVLLVLVLLVRYSGSLAPTD